MSMKQFLMCFLLTTMVANAQVSPSSLSYKTWEVKTNNGSNTYVREANGMVTETIRTKCVCLNGVCQSCGGTGGFVTLCMACYGNRKCKYCNGAGEKVWSRTYRYIDDYYSDGTFVYHLMSSSDGPSIYRGGIGYTYNTYGHSNGIKDEGAYYTFGGEVVQGFKQGSYRLSKDYRTLWIGSTECHLISKEEYDKKAAVMSQIHNGNGGVPYSGTNSSSNSSSSSSSSGSSTYIQCKYCSSTGRCSSCNGSGIKFNGYSGHNDTCPGCNGSGKCRICYGTGRL